MFRWSIGCSIKGKGEKIILNNSINNDTENKLDDRAKSCLDYLEQNAGVVDKHSVDSDNIFLASYLYLKGSKKVEKLTRRLYWLTIAIAIFTIVLIGLAVYEIPDYPIWGQSVTPISSQTYIDRGTDLVHDAEYLIQISNFKPAYDIKLELLTDVKGFYNIYDSRGYKFKNYVNSSNRTVLIYNDDKINPILLHIIYVERILKPEQPSIVFRPLPPNSNDSFYLFIRNTDYDIKYARKTYELTDDANLFFHTTMYDSWKNQSFIIYENNVPIEKGTISSDGKAIIDVRDLNKGECKTYLIKKMNTSII